MKTNWVNCPICDSPDMKLTEDVDGNKLINCTNHVCKSNGGSYQKPSRNFPKEMSPEEHMNKDLPTDINKHPILKQASELCQSIEKLPCSTENTNLSIQASELLRAIWLALPEPNEGIHSTQDPCNHNFVSDGGSCRKCGKTVSELLNELPNKSFSPIIIGGEHPKIKFRV